MMKEKILFTNEDKNHLLAQIQCFALDMDGTIYLGEKWIDGALEFIKKIEESGKSYIFLTNNSSKNANVYVEKLCKMGLRISTDKIITSGQATIYYIRNYCRGKKVFLLGNEMLRAEFKEAGVELDDNNPDMVITAYDTTITYEKMCKVCDLVRIGLPYIATHPDFNCPTETGFIPDIGAIHAFIHASTNRFPDKIIGKPNADVIEYLLYRTGYSRNQMALVGDRLYTDIAGGIDNGLTSVLVLSGEAKVEDLNQSRVLPHLVFDSVKEIIPYLL